MSFQNLSDPDGALDRGFYVERSIGRNAPLVLPLLDGLGRHTNAPGKLGLGTTDLKDTFEGSHKLKHNFTINLKSSFRVSPQKKIRENKAMLDKQKIEKEIREGIAERLNTALERLNHAGYSNARIGDRVGASGAAVGQWRKNGKIAAVSLALLYTEFQIDPKYILVGDEEKSLIDQGVVNQVYERIESLPRTYRDNIQSFIAFTFSQADLQKSQNKDARKRRAGKLKKKEREVLRRINST